MAPLYELVLLTKGGRGMAQPTNKLIKACSEELWKRGAVISDIKSWGERALAYRIRKAGENHYTAQYLTMHVYCSPAALRSVESTLRTSDQVLRWMPLRQRGTPPLDKHARHPHRAPRPPPPEDLETDPAEAAKWEYRNLVMQRVYEGRTKQDLIAEQMVRHRFQHAQRPRLPSRGNFDDAQSARVAAIAGAARPPPPPGPEDI